MQLCGFEHSLALPFFRIGVKTDLFQSCGHCWVFQICCHIECIPFPEWPVFGGYSSCLFKNTGHILIFTYEQHRDFIYLIIKMISYCWFHSSNFLFFHSISRSPSPPSIYILRKRERERTVMIVGIKGNRDRQTHIHRDRETQVTMGREREKESEWPSITLIIG